MEERAKTKLSSVQIWHAWDYAIQSAKNQKGPYKVTEVVPYKSFELELKTLFCKLVFKHEVFAASKGAEIVYQIKLKGLLSPLLRLVLKNKMQKNLKDSLNQFISHLEAQF